MNSDYKICTINVGLYRLTGVHFHCNMHDQKGRKSEIKAMGVVRTGHVEGGGTSPFPCPSP